MFKPLPQMSKPCLFSMQAYIAGLEYKGPQQKPPASIAKACQAAQAQAAAPTPLKTPFQQHAHKDFARLVQPTIPGIYRNLSCQGARGGGMMCMRSQT